ncbi:RNA polymerase sigma-70 factor [Pedobacter sp. SYP-B3415]|uniref:RNA polymerase sigma-70 factor n=1 Tax=Pedobacter sp. SYP-B3415 TaxID=2496641 RepID=UPI00101C9918|nr:RNA polymerase sigma-70 factor [Pedobacter sp. SYP-B3415]
MRQSAALSDQELATALHDGDFSAFGEIYERFWRPLLAHSIRLLKDEEAAMDVVQDVFASLWEKRDTLVIGRSVSAFLYTCVRNRIFDRIARDKVHDRYLAELAIYYTEGARYTDEAYREKELSRAIDQEIEALPAKMREVFELSRRHEFSYEKIAFTLDISDHTVKKQISNALKILRAKLSTLMMMFF